jgi:hypothetical protein
MKSLPEDPVVSKPMLVDTIFTLCDGRVLGSRFSRVILFPLPVQLGKRLLRIWLCVCYRTDRHFLKTYTQTPYWVFLPITLSTLWIRPTTSFLCRLLFSEGD